MGFKISFRPKFLKSSLHTQKKSGCNTREPEEFNLANADKAGVVNGALVFAGCMYDDIGTGRGDAVIQKPS